MSKLENNFSEGHVFSTLIKFSIPFLLSNLIQTLYNVADMVIVGQFCGSESLSGVYIGGQATMIMMQISLGIATGGSILISQYLGADIREDIKHTIGTVFSILGIIAIILSVIVLLFQVPILQLMKTPQESFEEARRYLTVTTLGTIFIFAYNAVSAVMRAMGDSKRPMYFIGVACVTNIILDLVFVGVFNMKAQGAALATIMAQALSVVLCIGYLIKNKFIFDFKISSFKIHKKKLDLILRFGVPLAITNVIVTFSFIILNAIVNVVGGVYGSAAVGAASRINAFGIMPPIAMSSAVSTMVAQNIGAGQVDRAKKTLHAGMIVGFIICVFVFIVIRLFPRQLLTIFSKEEQILEIGASYLRMFSFDYFMVPFLFCLNGLFIGSGCTKFSMINNVLCSVAFRAPAAYILAINLGMGVSGTALGVPISTAMSLTISVIFYLSGRWERQKVIN